ncbi:nucleolar protein 8 [Cylas formicarius]|uniref:nucleolar protein 8 n=1 Tax=Cylas formicarius TaxID=197179 RepID=UPI002958B136|nr:nucleolar protein 8 [Cylas formicarius]
MSRDNLHMSCKQKRIFISDLPEGVTVAELQKKFSKYGRVSSAEIKTRKEITLQNKSLKFAYVTVDTDDKTLQKCFRDFATTHWHNEYLNLKIAKENFLEKLKNEKEQEKKNLLKETMRKDVYEDSKYQDVVHKSFLEIKMETGENLKPAKSQTNDNLKRLQSLKNMRREYQTGKALISKALSSIDSVSNNKIIFDEMLNEKPKNTSYKISLFSGNSDSDDDLNANFEVNEKFEGQQGQKLLRLGAKYKHDGRFRLNERFLENEDDVMVKDSSESFHNEKEKEAKILEEVLGKKIKETKLDKNVKINGMYRFDPSNPAYFDLERATQKLKENLVYPNVTNRDENIPKPEVAKEVFYKVTDNLKGVFDNKQNFNFLSTLEESETANIDATDERRRNKIQNNSKTENPFKYDSSDDDMEDIPHKSELIGTNKQIQLPPQVESTQRSVFWTEPFFFKSDDHRLQDGIDFIEKIKGEQKVFSKIRQELKSIVRTKIRNNEKKSKMFKKKLGSSQKKKHIRIKKALKR